MIIYYQPGLSLKVAPAHFPESGQTGLTVVMVLLALVMAAVAVLVLLYYRKRVRRLKQEIAHVVYTADPSTQPGEFALYPSLMLRFRRNAFANMTSYYCINSEGGLFLDIA